MDLPKQQLNIGWKCNNHNATAEKHGYYIKISLTTSKIPWLSLTKSIPWLFRWVGTRVRSDSSSESDPGRSGWIWTRPDRRVYTPRSYGHSSEWHQFVFRCLCVINSCLVAYNSIFTYITLKSIQMSIKCIINVIYRIFGHKTWHVWYVNNHYVSQKQCP